MGELAIRRVGLLLPALIVVLASQPVASTRADSRLPESPGRIVFTVRDGNNDLWTINPDGTGLTRLTATPNGERSAAWSPDGTKIAFIRSSHHQPELWVMDADGTNQVRLTRTSAWEDDPTWSPDGTKIAYHRSYSIWVMDADGGNAHDLLSGGRGMYPTWSLDGAKVAYVSDGGSGPYNVWTVGADGTNPVQLSDNTDELTSFWGLDWSPDGSTIAASVGYHDGSSDFAIYGINAATGAMTAITTGSAWCWCRYPSWSPDGSRLAFDSHYGPGLPRPEIFVANADWSGRERLTFRRPVPSSDPDWGPAL